MLTKINILVIFALNQMSRRINWDLCKLGLRSLWYSQHPIKYENSLFMCGQKCDKQSVNLGMETANHSVAYAQQHFWKQQYGSN